MPSPGSTAAPRLSFTRRTLRRTNRWLEQEHEGMNPHKFYRALRTRLARVADHEGEPDARAEVVGDRTRELLVDNGGAGLNTGVFTGRIQARSTLSTPDPARLRYRPWGPHGVASILLGGLVALFGPLHLLALVVGLVLVLAGVALFSQSRVGEVPLERRDVVSVLMQGESRENQRWTPAGQRSELTSEMDVVYGGEAFLTLDEARVNELPWALRSEIASRRTRWKQAFDGSSRQPPTDEGPAMGFLDALEAWARLEGRWTGEELADWQRELRSNLPARQAYTQLLSRRRATDVREAELDRVGGTMEALAEEMRAYVESERLPPLADAASETASASLRQDSQEAPLRPAPPEGQPKRARRPRQPASLVRPRPPARRPPGDQARAEPDGGEPEAH